MNGDAHFGSKPTRLRCKAFFTKDMRHEIPEEPAASLFIAGT
jgi:hypothetical protein